MNKIGTLMADTATGRYDMSRPSVMFEILRSFLSLGRNLNVSQTADELGLTRQTVKRHIRTLEEIKKKPLFETVNRQYRLTTEGEIEFVNARTLMNYVDLWLDEGSSLVNGLPSTHHIVGGEDYWAQRHPINRLWAMAPPLLKKGLECWANGKGMIEDSKIRKIRPYFVVFRKHGPEWICIEVGEKSAYRSWFGWKRAKSVIGASFLDRSEAIKLDKYLIEACENVTRYGAIWYDHVSTSEIRDESLKTYPLNCQRLVMSLTVPEGDSVVAVLVARTNRVIFNELDPDAIKTMPEADLMEFAI